MVASPKLLHLCSVCLHQWRVPQFALKYPCNPPPHGAGDRRALQGDIARGGGGLRRTAEWRAGLCAFWHVPHAGPCTEWCGDWVADGDTLCALATSARGPASVGRGVHRGRVVH